MKVIKNSKMSTIISKILETINFLGKSEKIRL
jgi:hypothetical protein